MARRISSRLSIYLLVWLGIFVGIQNNPVIGITYQKSNPQSRINDIAKSQFITDEVVIKLKSKPGLFNKKIPADRSLPLEVRQNIEQKIQVKDILPLGPAKYDQNLQLYKIKFRNRHKIGNIVKKLANETLIEKIEPNYRYKIVYTPNDPYYLDDYPLNTGSRNVNWSPPYDYQWALKSMHPEAGWDLTTGNSNVTVAVIDTGVDGDHPELAGKVIEGKNYINPNSRPMDFLGHGTHVAGIIAARANNTLGIAGVCPNCKILAIKVLDDQGYGTLTDVISGIFEAVDTGARVINLSIGGPTSYLLSESLTYAYNNNVVVVAAAGNGNSDVSQTSPANITCANSINPNIDCVITVSAVDEALEKASYSNWGGLIDVAAPGGRGNEYNVLSLKAASIDFYLNQYIVGDNYLRLSGTSMASPHVAGLAGLLLSNNENLTSDGVRNIILNSADDLGEENFDPEYGYGLADISRSLSELDTTNLPRTFFHNHHYDSKTRMLTLYTSVSGPGITTYELFASLDGRQWFSTNVKGGGTFINSPLPGWEIPDELSPRLLYLKLEAKSLIDGRTKIHSSVKQFSHIENVKWSINMGDQGYLATTSIADVNQDGLKEVLTYSNQNLYVLQSSGLNLSGWPVLHTGIEIQPSMGDIDQASPGLEIVYGQSLSDTEMEIVARTSEGKMVNGFPRKLPFGTVNPLTPILLTNFTCDVEEDIFFWSLEERYDSKYPDRPFVYVIYGLDKSGKLLNNFPVLLNDSRKMNNTSTDEEIFLAGNYQNDNCSEIVFSTNNNNISKLYLINDAGLSAAFELPFNLLGAEATTANFDTDNLDEIAVYDYSNNKLVFLDGQGNFDPVYDFSNLSNVGSYYPTHGLVDVDQDGKPEIWINWVDIYNLESFLWLLNSNGQVFESFPRKDVYITGSKWGAQFLSVSADTDLDGNVEVIRPAISLDNIFGVSWIGESYRFSQRFGLQIDYMPELVFPVIGYSDSSLAIDDLDSDGFYEVVKTEVPRESFLYVNTNINMRISAYQISKPGGRLDWSQYRGDSKHQGNFPQFNITDVNQDSLENSSDWLCYLKNYGIDNAVNCKGSNLYIDLAINTMDWVKRIGLMAGN